MMLLTVNFIVWLWGKRPWAPCDHRHYTERRTFSSDGTPMVMFECHDCGHFDKGHVYGPSHGEPGSENWEGVSHGCK